VGKAARASLFLISLLRAGKGLAISDQRKVGFDTGDQLKIVTYALPEVITHVELDQVD